MVVPTFTWTLCAMIQSGEYIFSSQWAKKNVHFDMTSAETLWMMMHDCSIVTPNDVAALVFGRADPGDTEYDGVDFDMAVRRAQDMRANRTEEELDFGTVPSIQMSQTHSRAMIDSDGYMTLSTPLVGSLSNPRPPIMELSSQTRNLLSRKRRRAEVAADIGESPLDFVVDDFSSPAIKQGENDTEPEKSASDSEQSEQEENGFVRL